jgi:flagellar biosynthetic protein FliP
MGKGAGSRHPAAGRNLVIVATALALALGLVLAASSAASSEPLPVPQFSVEVGTATQPKDVAVSLEILALLTVLSLAPAIMVLMTSFTRIVVVLSFVRSALGMQQMPPNQVLIGLALFLTFFVMAPVWGQMNQDALQPYLAGDIDQATAFARGTGPLRDFMLDQTREKDLALFASFAGIKDPRVPADLPTSLIVPAFAISELKTAFEIGFLIFIPFIVIDMIVASTLMSMGMLMLPPMMISLPFKILLFVLVDGWYLVIQSLMASFR